MYSELGDHAFQNEFGNDASATVPRLLGDFYREDDNVVRSVTMLPCLSGDFYHEDEGVVRGITMPSTSFNFSDMGFANFDSNFDCGKSSFAKSGFADHMEPLGIASAPALRFENGDDPPKLSPEISAYMVHTRLQSSGFSAAEVGNKLLAFLTDTIGACVTKVSRSKFTVRAQCFVSGLYCEVKVRVYKQEAARDYVMAFQKRQGDSIAFARLFQQAQETLQEGGAEPMGLSGEVHVEIPATVVLPAEHSIAPLLSMAATSQDVHLLAEVASGLCALAQDAQVAAELRMPCAYSVLQELEHMNDFRIADPTSRVLSCVYGH